MHPTCAEWNAAALPIIEQLQPDLVITMGSVTASRRVESVNAGELAVWRRLVAGGIDVAAIRDTPRFTENMPECVAAAQDPRQCGRPRTEVYAPVDPVVSATSLLKQLYPIDVADLFCGERWCPAVVGGVLVYRDASHVTETYAATLTMPLRDRLDAALPATYTGLE
ncbi:SGNH hydrolase domain-containing protein [Salana multivorans]